MDVRIYDSVKCSNFNPPKNIMWTKDDEILALDEVIGPNNIYKTSAENLLKFYEISSQHDGVYKCYSRDSGLLLSRWNATLRSILILLIAQK